MVRTSHIMLPHSNAVINTLSRKVQGGGVGAVLLDGGRGGQSSYIGGIDEYIKSTGNTYLEPKGKGLGAGLSDKLAPSLSKLNIKSNNTKPKVKNISLNI